MQGVLRLRWMTDLEATEYVEGQTADLKLEDIL